MELYFPRCYDARAVPRAPTKYQQGADKAARIRAPSAIVHRADAIARLGRGWPARCLASVALLVAAAACSSLAETQASGDYAGRGSGGGDTPGPRGPANPTSSDNPVPAATPNGGPDEGGEEGPGATETNFLTLPCATDADCGGSPCILPADAEAAPLVSVSDAGASDSRGLDAGATDGGLTDAGPPPILPWGRCAPVD